MSTEHSPPDLEKRESWLRLASLVVGVLTPVAAFIAGQVTDVFWIKLLPVPFAVATAILVYTLWRTSETLKKRAAATADAEKSKLDGEKADLEKLLEAEQVKTRAAISSLFLPPLTTLQKLATWDLDRRRAEISGFRDGVVQRACQFVRAEKSRAAYFQIEDMQAANRRMVPFPVAAVPGRTDEFTSQFAEGAGPDQDVWTLIDGDADAVLVVREPDETRVYGTYISAPVRAGALVFGMLTINVLPQGGLSEDDRLAMIVLARLLGAAEALVLSTHQRNALASMSASRGTLPAGGSS